MNIVYALTRNVYEWLLPSIRSLAEQHPDARVFILCEDDEFPLELPIKAEIINVRDQRWFPESGVNYHNMFTYINLLKVVYPSILPVDKVIHLDIDTVIVDKLDEFWNTDVTDKWFAAVPEYKGSYKPFGNDYYNMGVALINLRQMFEDNIEPIMVHYLNTISQPWADQDAWNRYGLENDKIIKLPVRFNESDVTGKTDNPAIIHFCSKQDWYSNRSIDRHDYLERYL